MVSQSDRQNNTMSVVGVLVIVGFVLTRLWMMAFFQPAGTDIPYYYMRAVTAVDFEKTPYRDFQVEYPPLAMWTIALPAHLDGGKVTTHDMRANRQFRYLPGYAFVFKLLMFGCDVLAFMLFRKTVQRVAPSRLTFALMVYVLATTILGNVIYDRLDAGLLLGLNAWAFAWVRTRDESGWTWLMLTYAALGLAVGYKLIPILLLPFMLLAEWRMDAARWQRLGVAVATFGLALILSLFPLLEWQVTTEVFGFLRYHGERGIEIESTYASVLMLWSKFGGLSITAQEGHGGWNVASDISMPMAKASLVLLILSLGGMGLWAFMLGRRYTRDVAFQMCCIAMLIAVVFSKVLSVQYLVWVVPMALLATVSHSSGRWRLSTVLLTVIVALTTAVFPYMFFDSFMYYGQKIGNPFPLVPDLHWLPCTLLGLRNTLFVMLTIIAIQSVARTISDSQQLATD